MTPRLLRPSVSEKKQKRLGGVKIREKPKSHRAIKLTESQMIEQMSEIFKEKSIEQG